jgi:hypothetical protein
VVAFFSAFLAAGLAGAGVAVEAALDEEVVPELEPEDFFAPAASALESVR